MKIVNYIATCFCATILWSALASIVLPLNVISIVDAFGIIALYKGLEYFFDNI